MLIRVIETGVNDEQFAHVANNSEHDYIDLDTAACVECKKEIDPTNCHQSCHVLLGSIKVGVCWCDKKCMELGVSKSQTHGYCGEWEEWMGLQIDICRAR